MFYYPHPNHRYGHAIATVYGMDKLLLFGGRDSTNMFKNDTWIYKHKLIPKNGTYVSGPYYTNFNSSFRTISWNDFTPKNTSIKFQLRSANNESNLYSKPFVGPQGTTTTFYTTPLSKLWSGHDGDKWIQYKAYFVMNIFTDSLTLKDVTITYNCLPEVEIIGPKNGSLLANNKPTFTWTFMDVDSEEQKAFQLLIDDDNDFIDVIFDSGEQNTSSQYWEFPIGTNYTELPDGTYYWKVRTQDQDDDWTKFSEPWKILIDTHAPSSTSTWPVNNEYYYSVTEINGTAEDVGNGSSVIQVEITIKNLKDNSYWDGLAWTHLPVWLLAEGSSVWRYDTSSVFWETNTIYAIRSRATDKALNIENSDIENYFHIDRDSPGSAILTPIDGEWVNELKNITGTSKDIGGSGINAVEVCIKCIKDFDSWDSGPKLNYYWHGNVWSSNERWLTNSTILGNANWSYNSSKIKWFTGDKYLIVSRAIDNLDNKEIPRSGTSFYYDDTPPNELSININLGATFTTNTNVILSLHAEDFGLGISQMSFSTDNYSWTPWETFDVTKIFDLPDGDGEIRIYYKVRDLVNNIATPVFDSIILDSTPPEKLLVIINKNAIFTNSDHVTLTLEAKDLVSGVKNMTFSYDADTWLPWEPYKSSKAFVLFSGDGVKRIFFKVMDNAGNIANPVSDTIILDNTEPHSLSVQINYGASETNKTKVTLSLSALDDLSGVEQMSFSIDGINWTAWEPFNNENNITLPSADGSKAIYFRVKDKAGNIAEPVVDTILLNTTGIQAQKIQKEKSSENLLYWYVIIILIFCILGITISWLFLFRKEKQRIEQKLLLPGLEALKPEILPGSAVISTQIPAPPTPEQLPAGPTVIPTVTETPIITKPPSPLLAKSTQIESTTTPTQPEQATISQVPQLPPAQEQNVESMDITSTPQIVKQSKEPEEGND
jgi:hypothetical protein